MKNPLALLASKLFAPRTVAKPEARVLPQHPTWTDDIVLRRLSDDYRAGVTKWVLASDLSEFFRKFDSRRQDGLSLQINRSASDWLETLIEDGSHVEKPDNDIFMAVGPNHLSGLRIMVNGQKVADISYTYNIMDSWFDFKFRDRNGAEQTRRFQCGMDFGDIADAWEKPAPEQLNGPA